MGIFLDPRLKKNEKHFFDLEAWQLTVGRKTLLERVLAFFPVATKTPSYLIIIIKGAIIISFL